MIRTDFLLVPVLCNPSEDDALASQNPIAAISTVIHTPSLYHRLVSMLLRLKACPGCSGEGLELRGTAWEGASEVSS